MRAGCGRARRADPVASARRSPDAGNQAAHAMQAAQIAACPRRQFVTRSLECPKAWTSVSACGRGGALTCDAFLAILVQLLADSFALQIRQVIDEEFSLEVIDLMLKAHGRQSIELDFKGFPGQVLGSCPYSLGPLHLIENPRSRQTPFFSDFAAFGTQNFRIAEHQRSLLILGNIDNDQALMLID